VLVRDWMTRDPLATSPDGSLAIAVEAMTRRRVRRLVVEADGHLVGFLARSDVLRVAGGGVDPFAAGAAPDLGLLDRLVREAMTAPALSVAPLCPIEDAAALLAERKIGALPVVADGRVVGIVTESDVFRAFVAMLGQADAGLRICFDISAGEDAVAFALGLAQRHHLRICSVSTYRQDGQRIAVVRLGGHEPPGMVDELWSTGHRVLSVTRRTG
jgi:acetoin utilization protein AcuB